MVVCMLPMLQTRSLCNGLCKPEENLVVGHESASGDATFAEYRKQKPTGSVISRVVKAPSFVCNLTSGAAWVCRHQNKGFAGVHIRIAKKHPVR